MKYLNSIMTAFLISFSFYLCGDQEAKEVIVKADRADLFCRVFGKGEPIIVIHGGPGLCQDCLLPYMAKLAETHQVIFYDQRTCGLSTGEINANTITLEKFLDDLEAIRTFFGFHQVTLVGHSWGGFLAFQYAINHPEAIRKLILLNSMPPSSEEYSLFLQEFAKRMAPYQNELKNIQESAEFSRGDPDTVEKFYLLICERYCYNPEKAHLLNLYMGPKANVNGIKVNELFNQTLISKPFDFHGPLKQLKIPTLIIHGSADPIPLSAAQKLHESIPGSQFVLIEKCGHFPYVEAPEVLFKTLERFLYEKKF